MTRYQTGGEWEKRTARVLSDNGYFSVQTRGSRGPADLFAIKPAAMLGQQVQRVQVLAVQVKRWSPRRDPPLSDLITHDGWNALHGMEAVYGVIPLLADWCGPTRPAFRLRRLTGPHEPGTHLWPCQPYHLDELFADPT